MGRHTAGPGRFLAATSLAAGLLLCTGALPAQEHAPLAEATAPQVELAAEGTHASFRPVARVRIDRPGYLSLFEVEPGVGATMLYPDDPSDPERLAAGTHELRLNGLPTAVRRQLMAWHLGWAFAHRPRLVPENHLVAVVSGEPLDVSELRSQRVFRYTESSAGAGEVTGALLASVTDGLEAGDWSSARTSYDKWRDPTLLARSGPWLDAPFLPLARELVFTGWPAAADPRFIFACGPAFAATGEYFAGRTAFDLNVCRHAVPNRRLLADLNWEDPREWSRQVAGTDGRRASESEDAGEEETPASASDGTSEPLPEEVREALRRVADAAESGRRSGTLRSLRQLESIGQAMRTRGVGVDSERLGELRWKAEARARALRRIGAERPASGGIPSRGRGLDIDRGLDGGRALGARGEKPGAGIPERSARPSSRDVQRQAPDRVRRGARPAERPGSKKPGSKKPRNSSGDAPGES